MRGEVGQCLSAVLAVLLVSAVLPRAAAADEGCPPEPPYGTYACVLDFAWDQPVQVAYGVGTKVNEPSHLIPRVDSLAGDYARGLGGCGAPIASILITRRIQATEAVDPGDQAEPGVGTHSFECGAGVDWAGMSTEYEQPGKPWVYTVMATGTEPCEGHYTDTFDEWGTLLHRDQPESSRVTAIITCYRPGETEPSGTQYELIGTVNVLNFAEWDKWRWSQYGDEPYPYRRPLPVALGELTLPPIGSGPEAEVSVVQLAADPVPESTADASAARSNPETSAEAAPPRLTEITPPARRTTIGGIWFLSTFMILLDLARITHDEGGPPVPPTEELVARTLLWLIMLRAADEEDGSAPAVRPGKAPGPEKAPPEIKPKHELAGAVTVTPTSTVKIRGADGKKVQLKAGSWYQMVQGFDGRRSFYDKKGRLIGSSPPSDADKVVVRTRDEWSDARDAHAAAVAEYILDWFIEDPPPTVPLPEESLVDTDWDDDSDLDDDEPFSPDLGPDGQPVYKPSWVSLKRAAPVQSDISQQTNKMIWLEPKADGYLQGWYTRGNEFVLWDPEAKKFIGYIRADDQPGLFIRRHHTEPWPNDG